MPGFRRLFVSQDSCLRRNGQESVVSGILRTDNVRQAIQRHDRGQVAQCTEPLILSIDVNCRVRNSLTNPNPYMTMTSPLAAQDGLRTRKACRLSLQRPGEWQSPVFTSFTTWAKTTRPSRGTGFLCPLILSKSCFLHWRICADL